MEGAVNPQFDARHPKCQENFECSKGVLDTNENVHDIGTGRGAERFGDAGWQAHQQSAGSEDH